MAHDRGIEKMDKSILEVVHETANDLHKSGMFTPITMRNINVLCTSKVARPSAKEIREIREANGVSQGVFAVLLNVSAATVKQWEQGVRVPSGPSLRLLDLIKRKGLVVLG